MKQLSLENQKLVKQKQTYEQIWTKVIQQQAKDQLRDMLAQNQLLLRKEKIMEQQISKQSAQ